ncbi:MAG: MoaD/ThiS family protein [Leptolyngbyaceae cyanobacterium bins.349]|nr:MoaD/ThiS family protein [Leptolyngbyaceae cyanobacterium bins.349]
MGREEGGVGNRESEVGSQEWMGTMIQITVKLFAVYQDVYGVPELRLELPAGSTVAAVRDRLLAERPELAGWRNLTQFGINLEAAAPDTVLQDGDEVVLIPPVSGG